MALVTELSRCKMRPRSAWLDDNGTATLPRGSSLTANEAGHTNTLHNPLANIISESGWAEAFRIGNQINANAARTRQRYLPRMK